LCGLMEIASGALRGLKRSMSSAVISLIFACLLRVVWIATIFKLYPTPECIYITYPISWVLTAAVLLIFVVQAVKKEIALQKVLQIQYKYPLP
ncbi:MAG: hypothetical protein IKJ00_02150, partial [Clostridia bacterium]|nr:hypothetical protein [Clostridia bacterium]